MNIGKSEEQRRRGDRAERLLNDELLKEVLESIENNIIKLWKQEEDPVIRERLWNTYQGHQDFTEALKLFIRNGKAAEKELQKIHNK